MKVTAEGKKLDEDAPPPVNIGWDSHKAAVSQETFENNSPYRNA